MGGYRYRANDVVTAGCCKNLWGSAETQKSRKHGITPRARSQATLAPLFWKLLWRTWRLVYKISGRDSKRTRGFSKSEEVIDRLPRIPPDPRSHRHLGRIATAHRLPAPRIRYRFGMREGSRAQTASDASTRASGVGRAEAAGRCRSAGEPPALRGEVRDRCAASGRIRVAAGVQGARSQPRRAGEEVRRTHRLTIPP